MPFKDLPEGETHSQNDGCGEKEHNIKEKFNLEKRIREVEEKVAEILKEAEEKWEFPTNENEKKEWPPKDWCPGCDVYHPQSYHKNIPQPPTKQDWEERFEKLPQTGMTTKDFIRQEIKAAEERGKRRGLESIFEIEGGRGLEVYREIRKDNRRDLLAQLKTIIELMDPVYFDEQSLKVQDKVIVKLLEELDILEKQ